MVRGKNPSSPLSKYEVRYEPFPCVRGLECRKGRFAENVSPSSENAKVERNGSIEKSSLALSEDEVSHKLSLGLEVSRVGMVGSQRTPPPSSENAKADQCCPQLSPH